MVYWDVFGGSTIGELFHGYLFADAEKVKECYYTCGGLIKGTFIFYEVGGLVGFFELPLRSCMAPTLRQ